MPKFFEKNGVLASPSESFYVSELTDMGGDAGNGASFPTTIVIFVNNAAKITPPPTAPTNSISLQLFPSGRVSYGLDSNGNINVMVTFVGCDATGNTAKPDGRHYVATDIPGILDFIDGWSGQQLRAQINYTAGTRVNFSVQCAYGADEMVESDPNNPDPTQILNAPTNCQATSVERTHVHLTWNDNSNNELGFAIERSVDNGLAFIDVAQMPAGVTSYDDYGVAVGTTYIYRVRAFMVTGIYSEVGIYSAYSNLATIVFDQLALSQTMFPRIVWLTGPLTAAGPLPSTVRLTPSIIPGTAYTIQTMTWKQTAGPASPTISSPGAQATDVVFATYVPGVYVFSLTLKGVLTASGAPGPDISEVFSVAIPFATAPVVKSGISVLTF